MGKPSADNPPQARLHLVNRVADAKLKLRWRSFIATATSMVVTLHWRAHSLSVEFTSFEISRTAGQKRFIL